MSLYNILFGQNILSKVLLSFVGLEESDVPRFRDCYIKEGDIVVYTRTGGGNRECYCEEDEKYQIEAGNEMVDYDGQKHWLGCYHLMNSKLTENPNYITDEDDDFDSTYAYFRFSVPETFKEIVYALQSGEPVKIGEKFQNLVADMQSNKDTPEVKNALRVGKEIFEKIDGSTDGVVKI